MDDHAEHIDQTQWLPKGVSILTPERAKMLGMEIEHNEDGEVKFAQELRVQNIMHFLHAEGFLDDDELADGKRYEIWRTMFRVFAGGPKLNNSFVAMPSGSKSGEGVREYGFSRILRLLPKEQQKYIDYAIDEEVSDVLKKLARRNAEMFQRAFGRLSGVMKVVQEELSEIKQRTP